MADTTENAASLKQHVHELAHWISPDGRRDPEWRKKALSLLPLVQKELFTTTGTVPPPLGDRPAFPVWSITTQNWHEGMTYRQWLIGQSLMGQRSYMGSAHAETVARDAIADADAIIRRLDMETLDDKSEKEKPNGPTA
jgi:hypothetical protein